MGADCQSCKEYPINPNLMKILSFTAVAAVLCNLLIGSCSSKEDRICRLLQYNIADGMWYDQFNNYDRFVQWMQLQHPDIAAFCEAATHWDAEKRKLQRGDSSRYLPDNLSRLASRWGHPYVAVGAFQDNYPVAVTSHFQFEFVRPIGGDSLSHGALHVKTRGVNYVVVHLWPQPYSLQDKDKTRSDNLGDSTRVGEIRYILRKTLYDPQFADEKYWVMLGDFNTLSPVDSMYYNPAANYLIHRIVRESYPCDAVAAFHPGEFVPSENRNKKRIDFVYCSEAMSHRLTGARTLDDEFTRTASDHKPTLVTFTER